MAKYKGSSKRPQPKHKKSKKSRHDKRKRLQSRNPQRKKTTKAKVPLAGAMQTAVSALQAVMDRRIAFRLAIVVAGMLLADDRRTASAWFVAAGVQDDWDRFYDCLTSRGADFRKVGHGGAWLGRAEVRSGVRRSHSVGDGRLSHFTLWTARGRCRHPSQPDSRTGRREVAVRTQLGRLGLAGKPSAVGRDRAAAAFDALRPRGRHPEAGGKIWLGISHQASTGRRLVDLVHAVDPRAGGEGEGLAGGRWRLRSAAVSPPGTRFGHRGRQPLAKGRLPLRLAASPRSSPTRATPQSMARTRSIWRSVPGIARAGKRSPTIAAASR